MEIYAKIYESGREFRLNGSKITRSADILGNLFSVFFSPQELRLIQDGPDERRKFLNVSISQLSKPYFVALNRYNKVLEQRNNLLKNRDLTVVYDTLPIWDAQLCKYAAIVAYKRAEYIEMLAPLAKSSHSYLTDGAEALEISPEKKYKGSEAEIEKRLFDELSNNYDRDIRLGYTASGPHRDDIDISINGADAKTFASQGQTRTAALSVKLAEVEIFKTLSGEYPVLILDDVMSELDLPPPQEAYNPHFGLADPAHMHAYRARALRNGSQQNPHRKRLGQKVNARFLIPCVSFLSYRIEVFSVTHTKYSKTAYFRRN